MILAAVYEKKIMSTRKKGVVLGVATYKREDYALKLLDYFGFLKFFDVIHGSDLSGKQAKQDIILKCIDEVGSNNPDRISLVGDTESDAVGAFSSGIHFIGVTYGFGYKKGESIENAEGIIDYPLALLDLV